jgi:hypothetical protein
MVSPIGLAELQESKDSFGTRRTSCSPVAKLNAERQELYMLTSN